MGKFDGILLCSDLDDTLLTTDKKISSENSRAIEYFKSEGGLFTFATGRVPRGARLMLEYVHPNAPMICFNGGSIYDFNENKLIWSRSLDDDALKIVEYIDKSFDFAGIEVCTTEEIFFCKTNSIVERHKFLEKLPENSADYHAIKDEWKKVLFMVETEHMSQIRKAISDFKISNKYTFVQSSPWYYELLPLNSSKGEGLLQLASMLGIEKSHTVAVGDNENDLMMMKLAGKSVAVANAIDAVKDAADYVTKDNNSSAIAAVITDIESGSLAL